MGEHDFGLAMDLLTEKAVERIVGYPFVETANQCHAVSLAIVKSGVIPASYKPRVARGSTRSVPSQHSWVVLGGDCYDMDAMIIDATLWFHDPAVIGVYHGKQKARPHVPQGWGNIWQYGRPPLPVGLRIELTADLSDEALLFLGLCGYPLDMQGWSFLAHAPVIGWPAAEIIAAMDDDPRLRALIPIDIRGMVTDRNPEGLYF